MIASREGHLEVVEVLVAAGADLNKQEWVSGKQTNRKLTDRQKKINRKTNRAVTSW